LSHSCQQTLRAEPQGEASPDKSGNYNVDDIEHRMTAFLKTKELIPFHYFNQNWDKIAS
jgi:hypothetical protein